MKLLGTVIITLSLLTAFAEKKADKELSVKPIQEIIEKYNRSSGLKAKVVKTVKLELLDEIRTSKGEMFFQKGRVRLDVNEPDNSMMIVGGGTIWIEDEIDAFEGKKKHVTKIHSKQLDRQMRAPLAALFGRKKAWEEFKVLSGNTKDKVVTLTLAPKLKRSLEITEMTVVLDSKKKLITQVSYSDDLDNLVTYSFSDHEVGIKIPNNKFDYIPPANAEVVSF